MINTKKDLESYLKEIRESLKNKTASSVYALSAIKFALNLENIYEILDQNNKELAREIWMDLKKEGIQVENPPLLF